MPARVSYHTDVKLAYITGILPIETRRKIPTSTRYNWRHVDFSDIFLLPGNPDLETRIQTIRDLLRSRALYSAVRTLVCANRILRDLLVRAQTIRTPSHEIRERIIKFIARHKNTLRHGTLLRLFSLDPRRFAYWRRESKPCSNSTLGLCRKRHPNQLPDTQVRRIQQALKDDRFAHWPLCSIYFRLRRDAKLQCGLGTFYRYVRKLGLSRPRLKYKFRKEGIRAEKPGAILHTDVTLTRVTDNRRIYIHLLVDNFSRLIVGWSVADMLSAKTTRGIIENAFMKYLEIINPPPPLVLIVDGGPENKSIDQIDSVRLLVAQRDIIFSNSMVEAVNRLLKMRYIRGRRFPSIESLRTFLDEFVADYNDRPHGSLYGLTPREVFHGEIPDASRFRAMLIEARRERVRENRAFACEDCSAKPGPA